MRMYTYEYDVFFYTRVIFLFFKRGYIRKKVKSLIYFVFVYSVTACINMTLRVCIYIFNMILLINLNEHVYKVMEVTREWTSLLYIYYIIIYTF